MITPLERVGAPVRRPLATSLMSLRRLPLAAGACSLGLVALALGPSAGAAEPVGADDGPVPGLPAAAWELPHEHLAGWQELIRPAAGESHWLNIPWRTSLWQARQEAAAAGKPIFIWAGSGGGPVAVC